MHGGYRPTALPPHGRAARRGVAASPVPLGPQRSGVPRPRHRCARHPAPRLLFRPAGATLEVLGARLAAPGSGAGRVSLVSLSKMAAAGGGGAAGSGGAE